MRTECQVTRAEWREGEAKWVVTVRDLKTGEVFDDRADFLLNASGILKYDSHSTCSYSQCSRLVPAATGSGQTFPVFKTSKGKLCTAQTGR